MNKFQRIMLALVICNAFIFINTSIKAIEITCEDNKQFTEKDINGNDLFYYEQVLDKIENDTCIYKNVKAKKFEYFNNSRKTVNEKKYYTNGNLQYEIKRSYNDNSKLKTYSKNQYYSNSKHKDKISKTYYSNEKTQTLTQTKYNSSGNKTYHKKKLYYQNGKTKQSKAYSNYSKGTWRTYKGIDYRKVGNKVYKKNKTITKRKATGIKTDKKKYTYNKKGNLKSTKNGNAYRKHYTYFSNNKVKKYWKHKYTNLGKLKRITYKYYSKNKPKPIINQPEKTQNGIDPYTKCDYKVKVPKMMTIENFKNFCKEDDKNMNGIVDGHESDENIIFTGSNTKAGIKTVNNMFNVLSKIVKENEILSNWFEFEAQEDAIFFGYHDYKNDNIIALAEFFELYDTKNDINKMLESFKNKGYKVVDNIVTAK